MQWDLLETKKLLTTIPFTVEALTLKDRNKPGPEHPYYRLTAPDWVNILPITIDNKAVLIRQSRAGTMTDVLEVPGGAIDADEKDPTMAAVRELEEETGYTSSRILPLAAINPNPAIMTNRLHMFVALGCVINSNRRHFPDAGEQINVELVDVHELDDLIRHGKVDSCLAALTIALAGRYVKTSSQSR
jgi:ADP-ribose pyrophosphatase